MKIKTLLLLLLMISIKGFSQEEVIYLYPRNEYTSVITLTPACGKGSEVYLDLSVFWDSGNQLIKVDLKGTRGESKYIYLFPEKMHIKKQALKTRRDIWFTKEMYKCTKGTVEAGIVKKNLVNVELDEPIDRIKMLECSDNSSVLTFYFREAIVDYEDITIPLNLYVASRETAKGGRHRKVEYVSHFTIVPLLQTSCDDPDLDRVIQTLVAETEAMRAERKTILRETDNLAGLDSKVILKTPEKQLGKEKEITQIKDQRFAGCDNLKKVIHAYNESLEERNKAIFNYNLVLDDLVEQLQPKISGKEVNCRNLYKANEQLAELLLDIKNSKNPKAASFRQEFEKIKSSVSNPNYKNCKSDYKVFESLCSKIENRFNQ